MRHFAWCSILRNLNLPSLTRPHDTSSTGSTARFSCSCQIAAVRHDAQPRGQPDRLQAALADTLRVLPAAQSEPWQPSS